MERTNVDRRLPRSEPSWAVPVITFAVPVITFRYVSRSASGLDRRSPDRRGGRGWAELPGRPGWGSRQVIPGMATPIARGLDREERPACATAGSPAITSRRGVDVAPAEVADRPHRNDVFARRIRQTDRSADLSHQVFGDQVGGFVDPGVGHDDRRDVLSDTASMNVAKFCWFLPAWRLG